MCASTARAMRGLPRTFPCALALFNPAFTRSTIIVHEVLPRRLWLCTRKTLLVLEAYHTDEFLRGFCSRDVAFHNPAITYTFGSTGKSVSYISLVSKRTFEDGLDRFPEFGVTRPAYWGGRLPAGGKLDGDELGRYRFTFFCRNFCSRPIEGRWIRETFVGTSTRVPPLGSHVCSVRLQQRLAVP
jgi:hypothetical protein